MNLTFYNSDSLLNKRRRTTIKPPTSMMNARRSEPSRPSMVQDMLTLEKTEPDLNIKDNNTSTITTTNPTTNSVQIQLVQPSQPQQLPQLQPKQSFDETSMTRVSRVPKLPDLKTRRRIGADFEDLYSRYSKSDREFIEKFPAKVELTVTDVGKQFISNEKRKHVVFKRNVQNFHQTQENALEDKRYKNLVNYLVTH